MDSRPPTIRKQQIEGIPLFDLYTFQNRIIFVMPFGKVPPPQKRRQDFPLPRLGNYILADTPQILFYGVIFTSFAIFRHFPKRGIPFYLKQVLTGTNLLADITSGLVGPLETAWKNTTGYSPRNRGYVIEHQLETYSWPKGNR